jgi:hypothetical protein
MDKLRSNSLALPSLREGAGAQSAGQGARNEASANERRRDVRYPVSAAAEIVEARSRTRLSGRASDISLSGCYLDAINLFPVGAVVGLRLTAETRAFECEARVTYSLPGMGMGLAFTRMSSSQTAALREWIAELSGQGGDAALVEPEIQFEETKPPAATTRDSNGWQDVFGELVSILQRKGILTETEANTLRSRRVR